jgi:hypothetical protein
MYGEALIGLPSIKLHTTVVVQHIKNQRAFVYNW